MLFSQPSQIIYFLILENNFLHSLIRHTKLWYKVYKVVCQIFHLKKKLSSASE